MASKQYIYFAVDRMVKRLLREEIAEQGHRLTGTMEESIQIKTGKEGQAYTFAVFILYYAQQVNEGVPKEEIDAKVIPGLTRYFILRGVNPADAVNAAWATYHTWKREGMPTEASKRFSRTGTRKNFIGNAFIRWNERIERLMDEEIELNVNPYFLRIKSQTI